MAGNVQSKYLKKIFFGSWGDFLGHDQKISKKVFSLFLGSPCRETPKNAIKKIKKRKRKKSVSYSRTSGEKKNLRHEKHAKKMSACGHQPSCSNRLGESSRLAVFLLFYKLLVQCDLAPRARAAF